MSSDRLTSSDRDRLLAALADLQRLVESIKPDRSCYSCNHASIMMTGALRCARWDSDVPQDARKAGCDEHKDQPNEIPF